MIGTINKVLIIFVLSIGSFHATAETSDMSSIEIENQRSNPTYQMWDKILQANVSKTGVVNYKGIKADPNFNKLVEIFNATDVSTMTKAESKVFWINAYNIYTIKLIIDNYPLKSIMDLDGGKPWDKKFITISGKSYSLNDIENNILRKKYNDPRIHFAINCASFSCPTLYNHAFFVGSEESILNTLARKFVNDPKRNKISEKKIEISSIFDWYNVDFVKNGNLIRFLNQYSDLKIDDDATISYMNYNWNLNNK